MYSLMFPLPLYLIETSLLKRLLAFVFSFLANNCWTSSRNFFSIAIFSNRVPKCFRNRAFHNHYTHSIGSLPFLYFSLISIFFSSNGFVLPKSYVQIHTTKDISTLSFQTLKFVPFSIGMLLNWAETLAAEAEATTTVSIKNIISKNNGKIHTEIPRTALILNLWIEN